jgi:hypothetical protein
MMMITIKRTLVLAGLMAVLPAMSASAQYALSNYGPWPAFPLYYQSAGSTAPGDIARGLGVYYQGYGDFLVKEAMAASIHDARARAANDYEASVRLSIMREGAMYQRLAKQRNIEALRAMEQAKKYYPTASDIHRGDAINRLLRDLADPSMELRGTRAEDIRLDARLVRALPIQAPAIGMTVRLDDSDRGGLPAEFVKNVIEADPMTYAAFQMDLKDRRGVPLMTLVEFLRAFQLQLGNAERPEERMAHEALYRKLSDLRPMLARKAPDRDDQPNRVANVRPAAAQMP